MNVIIDTCVWSQVLRRNAVVELSIQKEVQELIIQGRTQMIGPIRQELLSGIKHSTQFSKLKNIIAKFPDLPLTTPIYENAAELFNHFRAKGIQASNIDCLICAAAGYYELLIYTVDNDFLHYAEHANIRLHQAR